jgi:hypothetical protein
MMLVVSNYLVILVLQWTANQLEKVYVLHYLGVHVEMLYFCFSLSSRI